MATSSEFSEKFSSTREPAKKLVKKIPTPKKDKP
jgi:hypothetical protein